jgi:(2Fe-2S) ferredoxin
VYPEATWYTYVDEADIDEIIDSHIVGGKIVERLLIDAPVAGQQDEGRRV